MFVYKDEEAEGSVAGSDRDSDMEFEQMLADAEEAPGGEDDTKGAEDETAEAPTEPPVRRKAKTKIGNKTKKKKTKKTTSKFPDGEESLQVELGKHRIMRSFYLFISFVYLFFIFLVFLKL